jgi:hypothetical protein
LAETLTIPIGSVRAWTITLRSSADETGQPQVVTSYTASAWTPVARAWSGDDQAPWSPAPTAQWNTDGSDGKVVVTFPAAVTAGREPGDYPAELVLEPVGGGDEVQAWTGQVRLTATPGAAAELPNYCTLRDMRDYAPWIDQLNPAGDAAWLRQRWRAWEQTNRVILRRYQDWYDRRRYTEGWWFGGGAPVGTFEDYLTAPGGLRRTDRLVEINARTAIALACESQVDSEGKNPFREQGLANRARANQLWVGYEAEVSSKADGTWDIRVLPDAVVMDPWPIGIPTPQ